MTRKVLINGAAGDTGRTAVKEANARGLTVRAMVRKRDDRALAPEALGAEVVVGDLLDIDSIVAALKTIESAYFYPIQLPYLQQGVLRMPAAAGRHASIAAEDQGRVIATILADPTNHAGKTYPLFGPVEMDHTQFATELSEAVGRTIVFQDLPVAEYNASLKAMEVPKYVLQYFAGALEDYQHGAMSGTSDAVETHTGRKPMSIAAFAHAHAHVLNAKG